MRESEELDRAIEQYHRALDEFARGDARPLKAVYSRRDDVTLANPFVGPAALGWKQVSDATDYAVSNFREGNVGRCELISKFVAGDFALTHELEQWHAKIGGRDQVSSVRLRVTTLYRREDGAWKVALRHADTLSTPNKDGPLRAS